MLALLLIQSSGFHVMIDDAAVIWVISPKLQSSEDMAHYEQIEVFLLCWSEYAVKGLSRSSLMEIV